MKSLVEARENFNKKVESFSLLLVKKHVVSFVYNKQIKKSFISKKCDDVNAVSLIQNELHQKIRKITIRVEMPYEFMKFKFCEKGYIKSDQPSSKSIFVSQNSVNIISHYTLVARSVLTFYRWAQNRDQLSKLINWHLRYSLLKTLAHKYSTSVFNIIARFSITPNVWLSSKNEAEELVLIVSYINSLEVITVKKKFSLSNFDKILKNCLKYRNKNKIKTKVFKYLSLFPKCIIYNCCNLNVEMHHVRKLIRKLKNNAIKVKINKNKKFFLTCNLDLSFLINSLIRKEIVFCSGHYFDN